MYWAFDLTMTRTVAEIQKLFLSSPRYAVVGASKDQSKYGTKVRGSIYQNYREPLLTHDA